MEPLEQESTAVPNAQASAASLLPPLLFAALFRAITGSFSLGPPPSLCTLATVWD